MGPDYIGLPINTNLELVYEISLIIEHEKGRISIIEMSNMEA